MNDIIEIPNISNYKQEIIKDKLILHRPKRKMRQNYYKKYNNYVIYLFYQCK